MSPGLPKFTTPVSIAAITITSLPIDIVAQTIGNLAVDINAQSLGNIGIDIKAQTLGQVDVNLKASDITLNVNIAASAVTMQVNLYSSSITLDINLQSSDITLNVNIAASAVTMQVNLYSSSITLDINLKSSDITLNVNIAASAVTMQVNLYSSTITLDINLKSSDITLDINIKAQDANVDVDIKAQSVGDLTISVTTFPFADEVANHITNGDFETGSITGWGQLGTGTATVTTTDPREATYSGHIIPDAGQYKSIYWGTHYKCHPGQLVEVTCWLKADADIDLSRLFFMWYIDTKWIATTNGTDLGGNYAWAAVTERAAVPSGYNNVRIGIRFESGASAGNGYVDGVNLVKILNPALDASLNLKIDVAAQSIGNIDVDIAAQTVGNITIDIAAQTMGNVEVDIKAQTVDLNIKTSGGTNIVIDKLVQGAWTPQRVQIYNDGGTKVWEGITGVNRRGKWFPRGARGYIYSVRVYCRDNAAAGGTITVYIAPYIGAGYLYSATIAVGAGQAEAWQDAVINTMWNYDSIFIWAVSSVTDVQIPYDVDAPNDSYTSADSGVNWSAVGRRYFIRAYTMGLSVGDLPVSGTVNTVRLPSGAAAGESGAVSIPTATETSLLIITGMGVVTRVAVWTAVPAIEIRFYVDGVLIDRDSINPGMYLTGGGLNTAGYTASTPQIQLTTYAAADSNWFALQIPFEFRRSFEVRGYHSEGANRSARVGVQYNLIK